MSSPQATYGIAIVADDKTAKGVSSAEKRFGKLGTGVKKIGDEYSKANERGFRNVIRTFGDVEQATADAFGTRSVFGSLGRQVGAFRKIGSALGSGLGRTSIGLGRVSAVGEEASAGLGSTAVAAGEAAVGMEGAEIAATGLAAALGPVVVVGAAVVATLGAAAVAGYKFASGWAASTAQMGRFAEMTGISTKNLQELQGAAERYGINKSTTSGAIGSFAQTVHDARYGRNNEALALMMRLGVKFRTGADGNLDYNAMLADTADALARQKDPQTALMVANRLGVGGILPLLRKGSGTVGWEKADVSAHGVVNSDADVDTAKKFTRNAVLMSQMADRVKQGLQAATAAKYNPALEEGAGLGRSAIDGTLGRRVATAISDGSERFTRAVRDMFSPGADKIDRAANKMLDATSTSERVASGGDLATRIEKLGERSKQWQVSPKGAVGVMQVMPGTARTQARRMGIPFDEHRYHTDAAYNRSIGVSYLNWLQNRYGGDEVLAAAAYNAGEGRVDGWLKKIGDPRKGQISDDEFRRRIPIDETRNYVGRVVYGETPAQQHNHHHEIHIHKDRVTVRTTTAGSKSLAVSHAPVGQ